MNAFTRNMMSAQNVEPVRKVKTTQWILQYSFLLVLIVLIVFCSVCARVYMQSRTESLNSDAARLDAQIAKKRLILENCKNRREELCSWENIRKNITRFNLPLAPRRPDQVVVVRSGRPEVSAADIQRDAHSAGRDAARYSYNRTK